MRILFVTNMFPSLNPNFGIFVKEQIDDIHSRIKCESDLYFIDADRFGKIEYLKSIFKIPKIIRQKKPDIIHIHYGLSAVFLFFFKPKAKIFLTLHGSDILSKQGKGIQVYLTKKIVKKVDKVFILSKEMENIIKPITVNYQIIPCGVNTAFFKPTGVVLNDKKIKTMIFPGNPATPVKNFELFDRIIDNLNKTTNYNFVYKPFYNLSREGIRDLLNNADCLLMTSFSEGSPQSVKEALSCNLPVVSVPVGDIANMLADLPSCYISSSYSIQELSQLVINVIESRNSKIRTQFIDKGIYDNLSVTNKILQNYNSW